MGKYSSTLTDDVRAGARASSNLYSFVRSIIEDEYHDYIDDKHYHRYNVKHFNNLNYLDRDGLV